MTTRPAKEIGPPRAKLDLSLAGPREIAYGQTTVYRLSLSNAGTADAENVIIRLLPVDATDQGTSHNFGRLTAGEMKVVEVELVARQIGAVVIRAQVAADGGIQSDAKQDVQVIRDAPLQITVRGPESVQFNTPTAYVIVVKNAGREPIEKAQVSANLPEGATFVSATCDGHVSSDRQKIEWPGFPIRGGAEIALEVKCQSAAAGSYRLLADVAASGDIHLSGESLIRVDSFADLRLDVIDPQGPMAVGQEGLYEIHLVNRGNKAAEKVDIRALFSRGIDPVEASGAAYQFGDGSVNFSVIPRLEPGKELVLKVKAVAKQPGQHIFRVEAETPDTEQKLAWEQSKRYSGEVAAMPSRSVNERTARRVQPGEPTPASPK